MEKWKVDLMVEFEEFEEMDLLPIENWFGDSKVVCTEDECFVNEEFYEMRLECFKPRSVNTRNDDFYKSQKRENRELDRLLDEIYEYKKR